MRQENKAASMLKYVKEKLKKQNKQVFGNIKTQKYNMMGLVKSMDVKDSSDLSSDEIH